MSKPPYNPLDKLNLGKSVAEALLDQEPRPLGTVPVFVGAGIYAIYYLGNHPAYGPLAKWNAEGCVSPIYVGKAIPSGGRKGVLSQAAASGTALAKRLQEHADTIRSAENLELGDFWARWLVVDDIWIPLGETLLITKFKPVWNVKLDGFGNHDPGAGRYGGLRPIWDTLHPGRNWASRCRARPQTAHELEEEVQRFLRDQEHPDGKMDFDPASKG